VRESSTKTAKLKLYRANAISATNCDAAMPEETDPEDVHGESGNGWDEWQKMILREGLALVG
jgi:hypothetical protein